MNQKLYLGLLAVILFAVLVYFLEGELFDYLTDPDAQISVGEELGITPAHENDKNDE